MAILLTGGTGKTSTRIAALLQATNTTFLLASRRTHSSSHPSIHFDWTDPTTWHNAFAQDTINSVYMMEPQVGQPWVPMINFLDYAIDKGVKRFVLCAGTTTARGQDGMGRVWDAFIDRKVEFCVLRPTWFMGMFLYAVLIDLESNACIENLIEPGLVYTIGQQNKIFTACQDGRIPFVSADDIAAVAVCALTAQESFDCDMRVLGPELFTYDDVCAKLSKVLGRHIEHVKLGESGRYENLVQAGLSDYYARFFTNIEVKASHGFETALNNVVENVTGHPPKRFDAFVEENKAVWLA
jgi:ergot alkaloid biosynthesis protein